MIMANVVGSKGSAHFKGFLTVGQELDEKAIVQKISELIEAGSSKAAKLVLTF